MGFGKKIEFTPIPENLYAMIRGDSWTGKSTLSAKLLKEGGDVLVCYSNNHFKQSLPKNSNINFVPAAESVDQMVDPKLVSNNIQNYWSTLNNPTAFWCDNLTSMMEDLVQYTQELQRTKKVKGQYAFKKKADAMRSLRLAISRLEVDVIFVYHTKISYKDEFENGKKKVIAVEDTTLSNQETARFERDSNLILETVVKDDKYGVKVIQARDGRSITGNKSKDLYVGIIWDEVGNWEGFRDVLEDAVWGNISETQVKEMQENPEIPTTFNSSEEAVSWAWSYDNSKVGKSQFKDSVHATNTLNKIFKELKKDNFEGDTEQETYTRFIKRVVNGKE